MGAGGGESNAISDITPLVGLTNLTELILDDNNISNFSPLAGLTNLTRLRLSHTSISDLSPLAGLTNLTELRLTSNAIRDITPLAGLTSLEWLQLDDNNISDISPLVANTGFGTGDYIFLQGNPLSRLSLQTHIPALLNRGIVVGFDASVELPEDVNGDGAVNILDLVLVAGQIGATGQNDADMNGDGVVNILDLVLVAGALGNEAAAPALHQQTLAMLTPTDVEGWLALAQGIDLTDPRLQKGILFLEQLLASLLPKETTLLPNYPNPFNPETWMPYRLAEPADVTLTIYDTKGETVRQLDLGHQPAGYYTDRTKAVYWNGRNATGEQVASGVYFYHLSAGDYSATRRMVILK